jgi:hypothetical protein
MLDWGVVAATIVGTTLVFDLIDIRPQVGSFGFIWTGVYLVYVLVRIGAALLATTARSGMQLTATLPAPLLGFVASVLGVVVLQHIAVNASGENVRLDFAGLVQKYKDRMITEEAARVRRRLQSTILELTAALAVEITDEAVLRRELHAVLLQAFLASGSRDDATTRANQVVDQLQTQLLAHYGDDVESRRRAYAAHIAESNPDYARRLCAPRPAFVRRPYGWLGFSRRNQ